MSINLDVLTDGERFIAEWQYRLCGDFKAALAEAIGKADIFNRERLAMGFPDEVEAFNNFSNEEGWWKEVQKKAGITK